MGPAALALGALVLLILAVRLAFPGALVALASPAWLLGSALSSGVGDTSSFFKDRASLADEQERLLSENAALRVENAALSARTRDLERLLGNRTEPGEGVLAGVLSRPPVSPYDALVADAGSEDGAREGMRAEGPGGMPLGTVESVSSRSSRILLYSAPGRETEGWAGEARIPITLVGRGAGALDAVVAREAGISEGDLVYVAGPGALPIGTVVRVASDPSSPRSHVDIRPLLNPFSVTWLTIVP